MSSKGSTASLPRNISLFMVDEKASTPSVSTLSVSMSASL